MTSMAVKLAVLVAVIALFAFVANHAFVWFTWGDKVKIYGGYNDADARWIVTLCHPSAPDSVKRHCPDRHVFWRWGERVY